MAASSSKTPKTLDSIDEDLLREIVSRLPAQTFAFATCVNRLWNRVCNQILCRPKMLSALSLKRYLEDAVNEVLDKVLSEPIRPHFAIVYVGQRFNSETAHRFVLMRLSTKVPIITTQAHGIIGCDVATNEFKEIKWIKHGSGAHNWRENLDCGLVVTIGFVPGLKVSVISLTQPVNGSPEVAMIDKFVTDIREFTMSASGSTSPIGMIMFGGEHADMKPVLDKMNYAMSEETVIVGEESASFFYNNGKDSTIFGKLRYVWWKNNKGRAKKTYEDVAICLVFATDRGNPCATGEIRFSLALSTGVTPVSPPYKAASVRVTECSESGCSTWLTARREDSLEMLDGQRILHDYDDEIADGIPSDDLYVGVTKRRKCSIGSEKKKLVSSLAFHEILKGDEEYLFLSGDGIKTGDPFRLFRPDPQIALVTHNDVFEELRVMKQGNSGKSNVFGGLIFTCYGRGQSFFPFPRPNIDSSVFLENFHGVPLAGKYCCGEIGRGPSNSTREDNPAQDYSKNCFLHVYSAVYLIMLHTPKHLEQ